MDAFEGVSTPQRSVPEDEKSSSPVGMDTTITGGDLRVDVDHARVFIRERDIHLTTTEFLILRALLLRPSAVIRRDVLRASIPTHAQRISSRSLDGHISRLRAKLQEYGVWIRTYKGVGYRFLPIRPSDPTSGASEPPGDSSAQLRNTDVIPPRTETGI